MPAVVLAALVVGAGYCQQDRSATGSDLTLSPAITVQLTRGDTLEFTGEALVLRRPDGTVMARNTRLARQADPGGRCMAAGFQSVEPVGDGFTVHNQTCSGWYVIQEALTFAPGQGTYVLTRLEAAYLDRRTAEITGPPRILDATVLGVRRFEAVDPDALYALFD